MIRNSEAVRTFYHGSPTPNIEVLEPRLDLRLGIKGLFVADEPFGPMMFALIPVRSRANVDYMTKNGKFVTGVVMAPQINEEGWLYTLEPEDGAVQERELGQYYITVPVRVVTVQKVLKGDVLGFGWKWRLEG